MLQKQTVYFGRLGGDEFILIFGNTSDKARAEAWLKELSARLTRPIPVDDGKSCLLTFSAGLSVFPADGSTTDDLLKKADQKMYEDKFNQV